MKGKAVALLLIIAVAGMMMTGPAVGSGHRAELEAIVNAGRPE